MRREEESAQVAVDTGAGEAVFSLLRDLEQNAEARHCPLLARHVFYMDCSYNIFMLFGETNKPTCADLLFKEATTFTQCENIIASFCSMIVDFVIFRLGFL